MAYGIAECDPHETIPINPQTTLRCKVAVERDVLKMDGGGPEKTTSSPASCQRHRLWRSPRQRCDSYSTPAATLLDDQQIKPLVVAHPGRPLGHAPDMARRPPSLIPAPADMFADNLHNVARASRTTSVIEIAKIVAKEFPGCELIVGQHTLTTAPIRRQLRQDPARAADLKCKWTAERRLWL